RSSETRRAASAPTRQPLLSVGRAARARSAARAPLECREAVLARILVDPLLQGAKGLRAACQEHGAEPFEVRAEVPEPGQGILGEARVFAGPGDALRPTDAADQVLVRDDVVAEVVPHRAERGAHAKLEAPVATQE